MKKKVIPLFCVAIMLWAASLAQVPTCGPFGQCFRLAKINEFVAFPCCDGDYFYFVDSNCGVSSTACNSDCSTFPVFAGFCGSPSCGYDEIDTLFVWVAACSVRQW